ncbi:MAG: YihY/virulence factor BrkB family protein [Calditrichaceae bacterium]
MQKQNTRSNFRFFRRIRVSRKQKSEQTGQTALLYYLSGLKTRAGNHHIFILGGGLAFSMFACIMPFLLVIFYLVGNLLEISSIREQLDVIIETFIPYSNYSAFVKNIINSRVEEFIKYKKIAGYFGVIGLILASSGFFSSLRTILNSVYNIKETPHFLIAKLRDFGMVILLMVLFLSSAMLLPFFHAAKTVARSFQYTQWLGSLNVSSFALFIFSTISLFAVFFLFYKVIPYRKMKKKVVSISAFWAVVFWVSAQQLFEYYLSNFASLNKIYGTYLLFAVVAFWIYYSSIIFIIGAEIGQLYKERHRL